MCLSHVYELGSSLCKLLSTLKKNREQVPLHILKTQYKVPYEALIRQINETATAFVKEVVFSKLLMNPDEEKEEQYSVIQEIINTSGMLKEMNHSLSQTYDVELLHRQALKLRECIEDALYPYIARKDCLVVDMEHIEDTPIIYNTITRKVYENDQWVDRKLDLQGKFLLFIKQITAVLNNQKRRCYKMNLNQYLPYIFLQNMIQKRKDRIYEYQHRSYWEADFINRCSDRLHSGIGRCNLPYETLSEDRELLNTAYTIYQKIQDCNVAYNDTLDCVIDRIEEMIGEVQ